MNVGGGNKKGTNPGPLDPHKPTATFKASRTSPSGSSDSLCGLQPFNALRGHRRRQDDWLAVEGGIVGKTRWGPPGNPVLLELEQALLDIPDENLLVCQARIKSALKVAQEPLGHPEAARRDVLTAVPVLEHPKGTWIAFIFGVMGADCIILRVCKGHLSPHEDEPEVQVAEADWDAARDRWNRGSW
jgi:hypothetical protein